MVNFPTQIPRCNSHNTAALDLFFSDASICSTVAFLPLRNYDHIFVSVSIVFPLTSCYFKLLEKLQKQICRTVGPPLAAFLEPLAHSRNVASLSIFYRYHFGRCSSELAQLVPIPYSQGRSTRQWCNLTHAQRFWATKVCLRARKISKICLWLHNQARKFLKSKF